MAASIPEDVKEILDTPVFVHLGTVDEDGSAQVSVVWIARDGDLISFSSAEGRAKPRNLRRDPRCTLSFTPIDEPYRNIVIRGRAVEIENRGQDLIDRNARKYLGVEKYEWSQPGDVRVDIVIEVERVSG